MGRVLLTAAADKPWTTGRHLEAAVRDLGHEVLLCDYGGARRPDDALLAAAESFRPQLHVAWKGDTLRPDTLGAGGVCASRLPTPWLL